MSNNSPNRTGGQLLKGRTAVTEFRHADANAALPYTSGDLKVDGTVAPGSLSFQQQASSAPVQHGTTAVIAERHMSERSSGFQVTVNDTTKDLKTLANMSGISQTFTQATSGYTQATIGYNSTRQQLSLSTVTGLTTNDKVVATWDAGTLYTRQEERYVQSISGLNITLQRPFSDTPEHSTQLIRAVDTVTIEGGADFKEYTFNLKTTGDDSSVHILHAQNGVVENGSRTGGTNSQVMGVQLNIGLNSTEYTTGDGELVPKFSEEHDIPRNVALGINL